MQEGGALHHPQVGGGGGGSLSSRYSSYLSVILVDSKPAITNEIKPLVSLYISDHHSTQEPRTLAIIVPYTNTVQTANVLK